MNSLPRECVCVCVCVWFSHFFGVDGWCNLLIAIEASLDAGE
jgi:hypothetical protein